MKYQVRITRKQVLVLETQVEASSRPRAIELAQEIARRFNYKPRGETEQNLNEFEYQVTQTEES